VLQCTGHGNVAVCDHTDGHTIIIHDRDGSAVSIPHFYRHVLKIGLRVQDLTLGVITSETLMVYSSLLTT